MIIIEEKYFYKDFNNLRGKLSDDENKALIQVLLTYFHYLYRSTSTMSKNTRFRQGELENFDFMRDFFILFFGHVPFKNRKNPNKDEFESIPVLKELSSVVPDDFDWEKKLKDLGEIIGFTYTYYDIFQMICKELMRHPLKYTPQFNTLGKILTTYLEQTSHPITVKKFFGVAWSLYFLGKDDPPYKIVGSEFIERAPELIESDNLDWYKDVDDAHIELFKIIIENKSLADSFNTFMLTRSYAYFVGDELKQGADRLDVDKTRDFLGIDPYKQHNIIEDVIDEIFLAASNNQAGKKLSTLGDVDTELAGKLKSFADFNLFVDVDEIRTCKKNKEEIIRRLEKSYGFRVERETEDQEEKIMIALPEVVIEYLKKYWNVWTNPNEKLDFTRITNAIMIHAFYRKITGPTGEKFSVWSLYFAIYISTALTSLQMQKYYSKAPTVDHKQLMSRFTKTSAIFEGLVYALAYLMSIAANEGRRFRNLTNNSFQEFIAHNKSAIITTRLDVHNQGECLSVVDLKQDHLIDVFQKYFTDLELFTAILYKADAEVEI